MPWWTAEPFSLNFFWIFPRRNRKKRFKKLLESKDTAWRVTEKELARNAITGKYKKLSDEMIRRTDMPYAPWYVIDAKEKSGTALMVIKTVADVLEKALEKKNGREKRRRSLRNRFRLTDMKKGSLQKRT